LLKITPAPTSAFSRSRPLSFDISTLSVTVGGRREVSRVFEASGEINYMLPLRRSGRKSATSASDHNLDLELPLEQTEQLNDDDDKREYENFLSGLHFFDEDQDEIDDEEDEDEDFRPGQRSGGGATSDEDEDEDEDDEEDDEDRMGEQRSTGSSGLKDESFDDDEGGDEDDYDHVGATELKDLLIGSLEAMTGEFPAQNRHEESDGSMSRSNASSVSNSALDKSPLHRKPSLTASPLKSPLRPFRSKQAQFSQGSSIVSLLASQLFSGERRDTEDMLIQGMPVGALRKLIARQNSMASQLLVQVVLQASHRVSSINTQEFVVLIDPHCD
jgi:hypothetical protein